MARVNYSHQKRLRDLERQRKQEEKRQRKLHKDASPAAASLDLPEDAPGTGPLAEDAAAPQGTGPHEE